MGGENVQCESASESAALITCRKRRCRSEASSLRVPSSGRARYVSCAVHVDVRMRVRLSRPLSLSMSACLQVCVCLLLSQSASNVICARACSGFHLRFRDIARGGLRVVAPASAEQFALESASIFDEVCVCVVPPALLLLCRLLFLINDPCLVACERARVCVGVRMCEALLVSAHV